MSFYLAVALSLSIGWGIRGNFGHEYGAMIPGALAALAACILSEREDWRRRAPFFAFFGAIGWALGGSMSYMQVIAYTHSGHLPSQLFGFASLFLLGFLWAALGGAGTAFAAAAEEARLRQIFRPLLWVFASWLVLDLVEPVLEARLDSDPAGARRHESLLYWFDSDWLPALAAVIALLLHNLTERRFAKLPELLVLAAAGAAGGFLVGKVLDWTGLSGAIASRLVRSEGDAGQWERNELLINWPQFLPHIRHDIGWLLGLAAGIGAYFARRGKFSPGASLLLHMALGWWAAFLLLPTLLGARMTPPRGDNWAGILGVFGGATIHFARSGLASVVHASLVSGIVGGIGFAGSAWLKLLLVAPGNPARGTDPAVNPLWAHWQGANWHSFLEQSYGFVNGLGIALALRLLTARLPRLEPAPPRTGSEERFAAGFVLLGITYLNLVKNVRAWTGARAMPETMKSPLFEGIELSALAWFNTAYLVLAAALATLMALHARRRVALLPGTWLGRGQLLYVLFLWWMVAGNFERALVGFSASRLLTEGVILFHAALVTVLVLAAPRGNDLVPVDMPSSRGFTFRTLLAGIAALAICVFPTTFSVRALYGEKHAGHSGRHLRFGPDAAWRVEPLRKGKEHR